MDEPSPSPKNEEFEKLKIPRSSYSLSNAERFIEIFDTCIRIRQNCFIPAEKLGMTMSSMRVSINDALLYLIDNKPEVYQPFRDSIAFRSVSFGGKPGILIDFNLTKAELGRRRKKALTKDDVNFTGFSTEKPAEELKELKETPIAIHWKDQILSFLNSNSQIIIIDQPQEFNHQLLSDTDTEWLISTFTQAGIEYDIGPQMIKACKVT